MRKNVGRAGKLAGELGGDPTLGTVHLLLFVPTVQRDGKTPVPVTWTRRSLEVLGRLFRGATAYPRGLGVWRDDQHGGLLVYDRTTIVFAYVTPGDLTTEAVSELRRYLHRLGRETNQGEVGLVLDGSYIGITRFEEDEP